MIEENKSKKSREFMTSKPPYLILEEQFDKIMSSLILEETSVNPEVLEDFTKKNKLQKLSTQDITKLYKELNVRKRKRFILNHQLYQNRSKINQSQSEKQIKTERNLTNIKSQVIKVSAPRSKGELTSSTCIENQKGKSRQVFHKYNSTDKKASSSQNEYFGRDVFRPKPRKSMIKSKKSRSEIKRWRQNQKQSSLNKCKENINEQINHSKKTEDTQLELWLKKLVDLEQLHIKQKSNYKGLTEKEMKRLRKIHSIEEERLKQEIIRIAQIYLNF